jgi:hypothetical protein
VEYNLPPEEVRREERVVEQEEEIPAEAMEG